MTAAHWITLAHTDIAASARRIAHELHQHIATTLARADHETPAQDIEDELLNAAIRWKIAEALGELQRDAAAGWCDAFHATLRRAYEEAP